MTAEAPIKRQHEIIGIIDRIDAVKRLAGALRMAATSLPSDAAGIEELADIIEDRLCEISDDLDKAR